MWNKILNLENSLFPELQESLRIEEFSTKEAKLIRVLYFAEIENLILSLHRQIHPNTESK